MRFWRHIAVTTGLLVCLLAKSVPAHAAPALKLDADELTWNRLSYTAQNMLGAVTTEIQVTNTAAEEVEKILIPVPRRDAFPSTGNWVFSITAHSVVKPIFGSPELLKTQAWYNPASGTALQRIRWRQGKERWQKIYRFTPDGVLRVRKRPNSQDELDLGPGRWSDTSESYYAFVLDKADCTRALEPLALLFVLSAMDFESRREELRLCVFNKKQLHEVRIRKAGYERLPFDYTAKIKAKEVRREGKIEAAKISIAARSLAGKDQKPEVFSFLGLKGDFDIYVDRNLKIPIRIRGQIPGLGQVKFKLQKIEFRQ